MSSPEVRSASVRSQSNSTTAITDYLVLGKAKLSSLVVFSSVFGYLIVADSIDWIHFVLLGVGGLLTTMSANALNQVLERDYDKLMRRTMDRPLAADRMKTSAAVLFAGLTCLAGILILASFNSLTALLGMASLIIYAFVYTPLKRYGTSAVAIGAIPGALPVMIGAVSFEGVITWTTFLLFTLQFLWQFPHFWSIGYLSAQDYHKAGFKLLPMDDEGNLRSDVGVQVLLYSFLLIPATTLLWIFGSASGLSTLISLGLALYYGLYAFRFYKQFDHASAKAAMIASIIYLPLMLITYYCF